MALGCSTASPSNSQRSGWAESSLTSFSSLGHGSLSVSNRLYKSRNPSLSKKRALESVLSGSAEKEEGIVEQIQAVFSGNQGGQAVNAPPQI